MHYITGNIDDKFKVDCVSFTFEPLDEALERAREMNDHSLVKKYEHLIRKGQKIIPLCKGADAPDYCLNMEITSCKGCKDYRSYG